MINTRIARFPSVICFLLAAGFVQQSFAAPGFQGIKFDDGQNYGSVLHISGEAANSIRQPEVVFGQSPTVYNEFSINRRIRTGEWHIANASAEDENFYQIGFTLNGLRLDAFNGYGKSVSGIRNPYSAMETNLFHPGTGQGYKYSGFAATSKFSGNIQLNLTRAKIVSAGLEDRVVQGIGVSTNYLDLNVMEVQRGVSKVGSVYSLSTNYSRHQIGFDYLKQDNGASYQSINYSSVFQGIRYKVGFQKAENPLYQAKNDFRAVLSMGFGFGSRGGKFYASEETKQGNKANGFLIGAGAVGAALAMSSGSSSSDTLARSSTQHAAARQVLNEINPVSVAQNREYGGYVFRNADGSYSSTTPIKGQAASIRLPLPKPSSTATYHTHAAFDPRYDNENFSPTDLAADREYGLDGYLGTPSGAFKYHELQTGMVMTLGKIAN